MVNDSFGDVFGLYFAVTAPGFSDAELHELGTFLRREILTVDGVADVDVSGLPEEVIYVEPNMTLTFNQGIPPNAINGAIADANSVASAGLFAVTPIRCGWKLRKGQTRFRQLRN